MELIELPGWKVLEKIKIQEIKVEDYIAKLIGRIEKVEEKVHAYVTLIDNALEIAGQMDKKIEKGERIGGLCGLGIAVKDNICVKGVRATCSSRMLTNFIAPYDATVIERIKDNDSIILGKTNMDEFAMGSSTEFSYFGPTYNPWNLETVPGGSSGGSTAAVASSEATLALGSDTGGSIRCPASFCSVVGLKPTYGLVSRFGLIAYANSLEQIGPITKDVKDCALLLSFIAGHDPMDSTSVRKDREDYTRYLVNDVKGLRIGVPLELFGEGVQEIVKKTVWNSILELEDLGASYEEISLKHLGYALPAYYIVAMSEASSNLARFDGVRYGYHIADESYDWISAFSKSRGEGFGSEVKKRILLGTYALSAGYFNEYYLKAQKIRTLIRNDFQEAFKKFDVLISPTMPILPFKIGEKIKDPLQLYMCDMDTVPANLAGIPAISIPCGFHDGLPIGMQIMSNAFREDLIFRVAFTFEQSISYPKLSIRNFGV
ncbi:MAG: Asp-tRNA(Asn)/Glu-tRNA(Gln) amidotransferase subunit GatA [Candidatus Bathyarchaeia archaeon]